MPRVLIVDDDDDLRRWGATVLQNEGYDVRDLDSPETVVRLMLTGDIDLALVDYHMPGQSGLSLLRTIRAKNINTPVVMLTADSSQAIAVECFRNGATDFIAKPIDADYLAIVIQRALAAQSGTLKNMAYRALGYVHHKSGCSHFENPMTCSCGLKDVIENIQDF